MPIFFCKGGWFARNRIGVPASQGDLVDTCPCPLLFAFFSRILVTFPQGDPNERQHLHIPSLRNVFLHHNYASLDSLQLLFSTFYIFVRRTVICQSAPARHNLRTTKNFLAESRWRLLSRQWSGWRLLPLYFNVYLLAAWTGCIKRNLRLRREASAREKRTGESERESMHTVNGKSKTTFKYSQWHLSTMYLSLVRWAKRTNNHSIFMSVCSWTGALLQRRNIFFFSLGKVYLLWVCLCVCIQACPALAFLVFQVEVKTTISYLSVQKFPLRFYIHVSPVYWANPGNYLGVVIRGEIEEGKRAIRRKSDVLLFARPVQKCIF